MNDWSLPNGDRDETTPRKPRESNLDYVRRLAIEEHGMDEHADDEPGTRRAVGFRGPSFKERLDTIFGRKP